MKEKGKEERRKGDRNFQGNIASHFNIVRAVEGIP